MTVDDSNTNTDVLILRFSLPLKPDETSHGTP